MHGYPVATYRPSERNFGYFLENVTFKNNFMTWLPLLFHERLDCAGRRCLKEKTEVPGKH
jgi:hypothetical protein